MPFTPALHKIVLPLICLLFPLCLIITPSSRHSCTSPLHITSTPKASSFFCAKALAFLLNIGRIRSLLPIQVTLGTSRGIPLIKHSSSSLEASSAANSMPVNPVPHTITLKSFAFFVWQYSLKRYSMSLSSFNAALRDESL